MAIGILAYGSLRHDPGPELGHPNIISRIETRTPFGVEYGRYSLKKRGGGAPVEAEILVCRDDMTLEDATNRLWRREVKEKDKSKKYPGHSQPGYLQIEPLRDFGGVETVLYTDFLQAD